MAKTSPTARTIAHVRNAGGIAEVVEKWIPIPGRRIRKDLFGFADVFAVSEDGEASLIQVTSGSNVAARVAKARLAIETLPQLRMSGLRLKVHGWRKLKSTGWTLREVDL
jgi:hypothetical protein